MNAPTAQCQHIYYTLRSAPMPIHTQIPPIFYFFWDSTLCNGRTDKSKMPANRAHLIDIFPIDFRANCIQKAYLFVFVCALGTFHSSMNNVVAMRIFLWFSSFILILQNFRFAFDAKFIGSALWLSETKLAAGPSCCRHVQHITFECASH